MKRKWYIDLSWIWLVMGILLLAGLTLIPTPNEPEPVESVEATGPIVIYSEGPPPSPEIADVSAAERAFDERNDRAMARENDTYGFTQEELRNIRWQNISRQLQDCPVVSAVSKVSVIATQDTNHWVINLTGIDGNGCSLWLEGIGEGKQHAVRSITSYERGMYER